MHTEKREDPIAEMGYEIRDINIKAIRNSVIGFLSFAVIASILGLVFLRVMQPASEPTTATPSLVAREELPPAPNPLLQTDTTAKTDIMVLRQNEDKILFGPPTPNQDGTYRIPINQAMTMIAQRAAQTQKASGPSATEATQYPGPDVDSPATQPPGTGITPTNARPPTEMAGLGEGK